jgi:hypothetical protein
MHSSRKKLKLRRLLERSCLVIGIPLFMLLQGGCVAVPVPIPETEMLEGRRSITKEELERLVPGETTRLDLLLEYGEPDYASDDESVLAYEWQVGRAVVLWAVYEGGAGADTIMKTYLVRLKFDEEGFLEDWVMEDFIFGSAAKKLGYKETPPSPSPMIPPIHPLIKSESSGPPADPPLRIQVLPFEDRRDTHQGKIHPDTIEFDYAWGDFLGVTPDPRLRMPVVDYVRQALVDQLVAMGHEIVSEDADLIISGELETFVFTIPTRIFTMAHAADFSVTVHVLEPSKESTTDFHYELESLEEGFVVEFMQPSGKIPLIKDCLDQLQDGFEQDLNAMLVQ